MKSDLQRHEQQHQHAVTISEINQNLLTEMQQKLSDTSKRPSVAAGQESCFIFKVPETLIDSKCKSYEPHIISVGPFHHGKKQFQMIEEHKWRFLNQLLNRTGMVLENCLEEVQSLEPRARKCYSEITISTDEFIKMMVLDGCFIIELFRKFGKVVDYDEYDPLLNSQWMHSYFLQDLISLENQIPYEVLERLFELTKTPKSPTLAKLALSFFNYVLQRPEEVLENYKNINANHLLDLLRSSFLSELSVKLTEPGNGTREPYNGTRPHIIPTISKLCRAGIRLKKWEEPKSFLQVKFEKGVIHMPTITIDDFMKVFLLNSVAFERCRIGCLKHFTAYVILLDCLINTAGDAGLLCDHDIIVNYLGKTGDVALFINKMGKDISFAMDKCYLSKLFDDVNDRYRSRFHVHWAGFMYTYFNTPWSFISASAALVLLLLTIAQTVFTVLSYVGPP